MKVQNTFSTIAMAVLLAACGGGDSGGASSNATGTGANTPNTATSSGVDCNFLCINTLSASKIAMLKNDSTSFTPALVGSLAASATYSWSMGDGSALQTGNAVNNYVYAHPNMYRITLQVQAKDAQGIIYNDSKTMQVHVMRAKTVKLQDTSIVAIQSTGQVMSSGSVGRYANPLTSTGSSLGRASSLSSDAMLNFDYVDASATGGRLSGIGSLGECKDSTGVCPSFAIEKTTGQLWAAGNNNNDYDVATLRATGTTPNSSPAIFDLSRNASGVALNNIKYVVSSGYSGGRSYALRQDGAAFASGDNSDGRLGIGSTSTRVTYFEAMRDTTGVASNIVQLVYSKAKILALKSDGTVWAAGSNNPGSNGGLGVANSSINQSLMLIPVRDNTGVVLTSVKFIEADINGAAYAIRWDGSMLTHGYNLWGQLGNGQTGHNLGAEQGFSPALQSSGSPISNVAHVFTTRDLNAQTTFVVKTDGSAWVSGAYADYYGVPAAELKTSIGTNYADRFSQIRTSAGVVASNIERINADNIYYAMFVQADGKVFVQGKNANIFEAYAAPAVTTSGTLWQNAPLTRERRDVRYGNWVNAAGTALNNRLVITTSPSNSGYSLSAIDSTTASAMQAMRDAVNNNYCGYTLGSNGELYITANPGGNSCNIYAYGSAYIPAFPGATKTFLTGWE